MTTTTIEAVIAAIPDWAGKAVVAREATGGLANRHYFAAGYRDRLVQIPRIERALSARPLPAVPCHNDLLAENYIDDGDLLRIVDYEYSGNNDPCFELGNTCQELGWDDDRQRQLCAAYFG